MLPEVEAEPWAAGDPDAVVGGVDGGGAAPEVEVVVERPAAGAVMFLRGDAAGFAEFFEGFEERIVALGEIGALGGPVVHLGVDVAGVFGIPRRIEGIVPDALQVGGLAACAGRADEQVAAVLEEQRGECRVLAVLERGDAAVGRRLGGGGAAEIEGNAAEERAVIGEVGVEQGLVVFVSGAGEGLLNAFRRIGGEAFPGLDVGGGGEADLDGVRAGDLDGIGGFRPGAALVGDHGAGLESDAIGLDLAAQDEGGGFFDGDGLVLMLATELEGGGGLAGFVGSEAGDDQVGGMGGEGFAAEGGASGGPLGGGDAGIEVEPAAVVFGFRGPGSR